MRKLSIPLLAGLVLALCGCDCDIATWGGVRRTKDFHSSHPLKSGGRFSLEGFNGSVEISGWDQDTVDVSGTKYAHSDEALDAIKIDVQSDAGSVSVRAIRPYGPGNMGA